MPVYVYVCKECSKNVSEEEINQTSNEELSGKILFETYHSMEPSEEELEEAKKCPRCDSTNCEKFLSANNVTSYIRGYGWKDKVGARRDMHTYTIKNNDPYSKHRVAGEKEQVISDLSKAGKHNPKSKHFLT